MKKICMLLVLQLAALMLFAQKKNKETFDPPKDYKTVNGYTVRLMHALDGGFGFDILQNNKPVVHQVQNPLLYASNGIQKKEDAYKIAEWMIAEYQSKHQWNTMMPLHVASRLNIDTN